MAAKSPDLETPVEKPVVPNLNMQFMHVPQRPATTSRRHTRNSNIVTTQTHHNYSPIVGLAGSRPATGNRERGLTAEFPVLTLRNFSNALAAVTSEPEQEKAAKVSPRGGRQRSRDATTHHKQLSSAGPQRTLAQNLIGMADKKHQAPSSAAPVKRPVPALPVAPLTAMAGASPTKDPEDPIVDSPQKVGMSSSRPPTAPRSGAATSRTSSAGFSKDAQQAPTTQQSSHRGNSAASSRDADDGVSWNAEGAPAAAPYSRLGSASSSMGSTSRRLGHDGRLASATRGVKPPLLKLMERHLSQEQAMIDPEDDAQQLRIHREAFRIFAENFTTYTPILSDIMAAYDRVLQKFSSFTSRVDLLEQEAQRKDMDHEKEVKELLEEMDRNAKAHEEELQQYRVITNESSATAKHVAKDRETLIAELEALKAEKAIDLQKMLLLVKSVKESDLRIRTLTHKLQVAGYQLEEKEKLKLMLAESQEDIGKLKAAYKDNVPLSVHKGQVRDLTTALEESKAETKRARRMFATRGSQLFGLQQIVEQLREEKRQMHSARSGGGKSSKESRRRAVTPRPDWDAMYAAWPEAKDFMLPIHNDDLTLSEGEEDGATKVAEGGPNTTNDKVKTIVQRCQELQSANTSLQQQVMMLQETMIRMSAGGVAVAGGSQPSGGREGSIGESDASASMRRQSDSINNFNMLASAPHLGLSSINVASAGTSTLHVPQLLSTNVNGNSIGASVSALYPMMRQSAMMGSTADPLMAPPTATKGDGGTDGQQPLTIQLARGKQDWVPLYLRHVGVVSIRHMAATEIYSIICSFTKFLRLKVQGLERVPDVPKWFSLFLNNLVTVTDKPQSSADQAADAVKKAAKASAAGSHKDGSNVDYAGECPHTLAYSILHNSRLYSPTSSLFALFLNVLEGTMPPRLLFDAFMVRDNISREVTTLAEAQRRPRLRKSALMEVIGPLLSFKSKKQLDDLKVALGTETTIEAKSLAADNHPFMQLLLEQSCTDAPMLYARIVRDLCAADAEHGQLSKAHVIAIVRNAEPKTPQTVLDGCVAGPNGETLEDYDTLPLIHTLERIGRMPIIRLTPATATEGGLPSALAAPPTKRPPSGKATTSEAPSALNSPQPVSPPQTQANRGFSGGAGVNIERDLASSLSPPQRSPSSSPPPAPL